MKCLWLLGTQMPTPTAQRIGAAGMPRIAERQTPLNDGPATAAARARDRWRVSLSEPPLFPIEYSDISIVPAQPERACGRQRPRSTQTISITLDRARPELTHPSAHLMLMSARERASEGGNEGGRKVSTTPSAPRPVAGAARADTIDRPVNTGALGRAGDPGLGGDGGRRDTRGVAIRPTPMAASRGPRPVAVTSCPACRRSSRYAMRSTRITCPVPRWTSGPSPISVLTHLASVATARSSEMLAWGPRGRASAPRP